MPLKGEVVGKPVGCPESGTVLQDTLVLRSGSHRLTCPLPPVPGSLAAIHCLPGLWVGAEYLEAASASGQDLRVGITVHMVVIRQPLCPVKQEGLSTRLLCSVLLCDPGKVAKSLCAFISLLLECGKSLLSQDSAPEAGG